MLPAPLEKWLKTDESKHVGWKGDDGEGSGESVGHHSGRRIVEIKRKMNASSSTFSWNSLYMNVSFTSTTSKEKC